VEHDLEMKNRTQTEDLNTNYANLANIAKKTLKLRGFRVVAQNHGGKNKRLYCKNRVFPRSK